ncbi:phosphoenolpyruvate-utilizing N-terminal domain-containing protein [Escherichia coli]
MGTLTLLQSDSLDSYRAIPASAQDSTRLEHSLATLAEQLNQQLRERDGESKTILSAHLSLIQDDEFAGNIRRLMTTASGAGGGDHQQYGAGLRQTFCLCQRLSARTC